MRKLLALVCAAVLVVAAVVVVRWVRGLTASATPIVRVCTATALGNTVALSPSQAENAAVIAAVAERRGLPARAVSIALTAALQESKLENLHYGDADSLGLFQQRPSQGWGKPSQILDPEYAAGAFYDALVRVHGYQTMSIAAAAQDVQRSAFPEMYVLHVEEGRILASTLTGWSRAAFSCQLDAPVVAGQSAPAGQLTARAANVRTTVGAVFGTVDSSALTRTTTLARAGDPGLLAASGAGRAVLLTAPVPGVPSRVAAWGLASFLVAHAGVLHLDEILVDGRVWSSGDQSPDGWRHSPATPPTGSVVAVAA